MALLQFLSLFLANHVVGQGEFTPVDASLELLTRTLIDSTDDDREHMDKIYQYIIHNITYDTEAYQGGRRRINRSSSDVLRRRKAVCWGYAELLREMCQIAGIEAYTVVGYSKELPFPARSLESANHAWNAVKLQGQWYLLDATWDSGLLGGTDYFQSEYGEDYYLAPPELFVKNHLPIMPMWQLLECPVNLDTWKGARFEARTRCKYNYNNKIRNFLELSRLEQMSEEMKVAYNLYRTYKYKSLFGHSLIDIAFEKKEKGDSLLQQDQPFLAIEYLEAAQQLFEVASEHCEFYDWQEIGHIFTAVNLAQAYYQEYHPDVSQREFLFQYFQEAQLLVQQSDLQPGVKSNIDSFLLQYLDVLK